MVNPDIKWALSDLGCRLAGYNLFQEYYDGNHRLTFTTDNYRNLFAQVFERFRENLCPTIAEVLNSRLRLSKLSSPNADLQARLDVLWNDNRLERLSGQIHFEAFLSGDVYVLLWPDGGGTVKLHLQRGGVFTVLYDEEDATEIKLAAKIWSLRDSRVRINLFYPDRVEKWISERPVALVGRKTHLDSPVKAKESNPKFVRFVDDGDGGEVENPFGFIPVVHFANIAFPGEFGHSELADVIPIQDALNKSIIDQLVAGEFYSLPQRWATGLQVQRDPETGDPIKPFQPGLDRIWTTASDLVKFGEFAGADPSRFVTVQDSQRASICRVSGIPAHYFAFASGGWPSGEALKTAEARLTAKIGDRQMWYGSKWEDVAKVAFRMQGIEVADKIEAVWLNTEPRNDHDEAETAVIYHELGASKQTLLESLGFNPETERERREEEASTESDSMLTAFNRGAA